MKDKITIHFTLSIGMNGKRTDDVKLASLGVSDDDWADMTDTERTAFLDEAWREWSSNYIDGSASVNDD